MPTNPGYRHGPILNAQRKRCPVCHQSVYSLAGIHPQCAVKLSEGVPPQAPPLAKVEPETAVAVMAPAKPVRPGKAQAAR
jgi:hypothetical protein